MLDSSGFSASDLSLPLYLQLAEWIERNIRSGELPVGERLPPVRTLAQHLNVNRGSVASAYAHLSKIGLLHTRVGMGTFVRAASVIPSVEAVSSVGGEDFWKPLLTGIELRLGSPKATIVDDEQQRTWVPENGETSDSNVRIAMDLPLADHRLGYELIKGALRNVGGSLPVDALAYGHPQGLFPLRTQLAERARAAGIQINPTDILICNGTQQALSLVASVLIQPGDTVLMENPGYPGAARAFRMYGAKLIGVPVDSGGMKTEVLENVLRDHRPKLIYTVPSFQVPTGTTLDGRRRAKLYRLAEAQHIPIFEDEYVNQLYYGDPPPPPLKSLDHQGLVIYAGTFSKTLSASLRLGWIAAHPLLIARLVQAKEAQDIHTSLISQLMLDALLRTGAYDAHLDMLREHYGKRYRSVMRALKRRIGSTLRYHPAGGGFSIWATLPEGISATEWLHYARSRGVHFHRGASYFLEDINDRHVQLCFSQLALEEIDKAVELLVSALKEAMASRGQASAGNRFLPFS